MAVPSSAVKSTITGWLLGRLRRKTHWGKDSPLSPSTTDGSASRTPSQDEWVTVEYRVATGHWMTGFQPVAGLGHFQTSNVRGAVRWLRQPK